MMLNGYWNPGPHSSGKLSDPLECKTSRLIFSCPHDALKWSTYLVCKITKSIEESAETCKRLNSILFAPRISGIVLTEALPFPLSVQLT